MFSKFSGLKALYHLDHVKATLENRHVYPVHVNVDPTNFCNHKCIWCSQYQNQQFKAMSIDYPILRKTLEEAAGLGLKAVTYIGSGDSTVYKHFLDITRDASGFGLDQGMFTHGDYPNEWCAHLLDTFTWVRFSLDAATQQTHAKVHGVEGHFDRIIENIRTLARDRKGPDSFTVGVQFGLHQETAHEMLQCAKLIKESGADYFAIKPIYKRGAVEIRAERYSLQWENVSSQIDEVCALADKNFEVLYKPYQFQINNAPFAADKDVDPNFVRNYDRCYAINFEWWIRTNLDVSICGPMKLNVGNLKEQSFSEILGSKRYLEAIEGIDVSKCYRGCRPHYHNETMHSLANPDFRMHRNFVG